MNFTEIFTVMSALAVARLAVSRPRKITALRMSGMLEIGIIKRLRWPSLQGHEHQHRSIVLGKSGHRFAEDCALRSRGIGSLHRLAGNVRSGEQIAGLDRAGAGVGFHVNP